MMGDFDLSLINEFAHVPAFYNKASPHFKDKPFIDEAWAQISQKLGYDGKKIFLSFLHVIHVYERNINVVGER